MHEKHEDYMKRRSTELKEQFGIESSVPSNKELEDRIKDIKDTIRRIESKLDQHLGKGFE